MTQPTLSLTLNQGQRLVFCATASLVLWSFMACFWPDFFIFSKFIRLPAWASQLPTPTRAGAYLVTIGLLPVTWGTSRLDWATLMTFVLILVMPLAVLGQYVVQATGHPYFWPGLAMNYLFVLCATLAQPALALLALRWAGETWVKLN